jgi:hypothetical protein
MPERAYPKDRAYSRVQEAVKAVWLKSYFDPGGLPLRMNAR